jgi:hypothetical protein
VLVTERRFVGWVRKCGAEMAEILKTRYTGCPTRYRARHFFNISNTNEDIATKFQQEYVLCVRNEEECVCSVCVCSVCVCVCSVCVCSVCVCSVCVSVVCVSVVCVSSVCVSVVCVSVVCVCL